MIIHDVPQLSDLWWELRCGIPTASEFKRIITAKGGLPSEGQQGYALELAKDLQCQNPPYLSGGGKPINVHMTRGRNLEEEAVAWYAMVRKVGTRKAGFVTTDDKRFGCSPDSLIEDYDGTKYLGGIEVKCPSVDKHEKNVKRGTLPLEYKAQCHGGLAVTGLPYWIFLEYCPDSKTPTLCIRIEPDDFTQALKVQLEAFDKLYTEVKAKLGVTKEPEVIDADAIAEWEKFFETEPGIAMLNAELPKVGKIAMPTKRHVWDAIVIYGKRHGWVFKQEGQIKGFVPEEATANF